MANTCARAMASCLLPTLLAASGASCFSDGAGFEPGTAQLEVVAHDLQGRLLRLDVQYTGGCTEHEIRICWTGILAPSYPPQVPLEIHHYDLGDTCEALVSKSLYIDMAELNRVAGESGADLSFHLHSRAVALEECLASTTSSVTSRSMTDPRRPTSSIAPAESFFLEPCPGSR